MEQLNYDSLNAPQHKHINKLVLTLSVAKGNGNWPHFYTQVAQSINNLMGEAKFLWHPHEAMNYVFSGHRWRRGGRGWESREQS